MNIVSDVLHMLCGTMIIQSLTPPTEGTLHHPPSSFLNQSMVGLVWECCKRAPPSVEAKETFSHQCYKEMCKTQFALFNINPL